MKYFLPIFISALLFASCVSVPQPGEISYDDILYIQYGAETLSNDQASFVNFIQIPSGTANSTIIINPVLINNIPVSECIIGANEKMNIIGSYLKKINEPIKMFPGETLFDLSIRSSWNSFQYTLSIQLPIDLKPGMIYYFYAPEYPAKSVHFDKQFIFEVYSWPVGHEDRIITETMTFDLEF